MSVNFLYDTHTHTSNSPDAKDSVEALCVRGAELGLAALAVTEHCEINRYYPREYYKESDGLEHEGYNFEERMKKSFEDNMLMKEKFAGRLKVLCGVELGQGNSDKEAAEKLLSDDRIDYVIGSMHEMPGYADFYFLDYKNLDVSDILTKNFTAVYDMCKWGGFDSLGHMTYALRYIMRDGLSASTDHCDEIIAESLRELALRGKGLEINTSGLRQDAKMTFPTVKYVRMFRELGGEIITVGSDSHCTGDLAAGIADGIEVAREAGFTRIAYFEKRKPVFLEI